MRDPVLAFDPVMATSTRCFEGIPRPAAYRAANALAILGLSSSWD
jgi:hypothetical protein